MEVQMFSIFDSAAQRYMDPFPGPTVEFAIRGFKEACQKEGHQFAKFPEDYFLYHVGSFDAATGVLVPLEPHKVAQATSFAGFSSGPNIGGDN